jgi:hypothetical protein
MILNWCSSALWCGPQTWCGLVVEPTPEGRTVIFPPITPSRVYRNDDDEVMILACALLEILP